MIKNTGCAGVLLALIWITGSACPVQAQPPKPTLPAVERLGENLFRIGQIHVDTSKREISVAGTVNPVRTLEFIANPRRGMKAYESAVTLDTDAIAFNAALVLVGLDASHMRFGPNGPEGDQVEIWIETTGPSAQRFRAERMVYDEVTKLSNHLNRWLRDNDSYAGSVFLTTQERLGLFGRDLEKQTFKLFSQR